MFSSSNDSGLTDETIHAEELVVRGEDATLSQSFSHRRGKTFALRKISGVLECEASSNHLPDL